MSLSQYPLHHIPHAGRKQATLPPASNLPQNLQIPLALITPVQDVAENTPKITRQLAELQPPSITSSDSREACSTAGLPGTWSTTPTKKSRPNLSRMVHRLCRPPPTQGKDLPSASSRGQCDPGKCLRISPATPSNLATWLQSCAPTAQVD